MWNENMFVRWDLLLLLVPFINIVNTYPRISHDIIYRQDNNSEINSRKPDGNDTENVENSSDSIKNDSTINDEDNNSANVPNVDELCNCTCENRTTNGERDLEMRSLGTGDLFTPEELLPVAIKLLKKLGTERGKGRGIVSSERYPKVLADKIFAAYFLTTRRIVILKDDDISGLDALQALALGGKPASVKFTRTGKNPPIMLKSGQRIKWNRGLREGHYTLLTKKVPQSKPRGARTNEIGREKRHKSQIKKRKKRHLKLNRRHIKRQDIQRKSVYKKKERGLNSVVGATTPRIITAKVKNKNKGILRKISNKKRGLNNSGCTWSYECRKPDDLNTCNLIAKCDNKTIANGELDDIKMMPREKEDPETRRFRRMIGITVLDEEVEKIIERHIMKIRPEKIEGHEEIESVDQYFNNLLMLQHFKTTPQATPEDSGIQTTTVRPKPTTTGSKPTTAESKSTTSTPKPDHTKDIKTTANLTRTTSTPKPNHTKKSKRDEFGESPEEAEGLATSSQAVKPRIVKLLRLNY